jgi:hypothetical protein
MNSLSRVVVVTTIAVSGLFAGGLPAAAQAGGACTFVSDAAIAPARAIQSIYVPGMESCAVLDDSGDADTSILHITGPIDTTGLPTDDASAAAIESTPVDGFGGSAMLLRIPVDDATLLSLRVQRGDEVFGFNTKDGPDSASRLLTLAQKVLR